MNSTYDERTGVTTTYFDDGAPCSESWIKTCPCCGEHTCRIYRLCDGTGGGEYCTTCHHFDNW